MIKEFLLQLLTSISLSLVLLRGGSSAGNEQKKIDQNSSNKGFAFLKWKENTSIGLNNLAFVTDKCCNVSIRFTSDGA